MNKKKRAPSVRDIKKHHVAWFLIFPLVVVGLLVMASNTKANNTPTPDYTIKRSIKYDEDTTGSPIVKPGFSTAGIASASIGDLDGDGNDDIVVASGDARGDTTMTNRTGAVAIIFLNENLSIKDFFKITEDTPNGPNSVFTLVENSYYGDSIANMGDMDGDGVIDIAVGCGYCEGPVAGNYRSGAVFLHYLSSDGLGNGASSISIKETKLISEDTPNGFSSVTTYDTNVYYGAAITSLDDLDGNGVNEIAVGARGCEGDTLSTNDSGCVFISFMNSDGSIIKTTNINEDSQYGPNMTKPLQASSDYGTSITTLDDYDNNGVADIAVGATEGYGGASGNGTVYITYLNNDGTAKYTRHIDQNTVNGPSYVAANFDTSQYYGISMSNLGDLDGNGYSDLAVGNSAHKGVFGSTQVSTGGVYIHFLGSNGVPIATSILDEASANGRMTVDLTDHVDSYGSSITLLGDMDNNGVPDLLVGSRGDRGNVSGNVGAGAFYIHLMEKSSNISYDINRIYSSSTDRVYGLGETVNISMEVDSPENLSSRTYVTVDLNTGVTVTLNTVSGKTVSGSYTVNENEAAAVLTVSAISAAYLEDTDGNFSYTRTIPTGENLGDNNDIGIESGTTADYDWYEAVQITTATANGPVNDEFPDRDAYLEVLGDLDGDGNDDFMTGRVSSAIYLMDSDGSIKEKQAFDDSEPGAPTVVYTTSGADCCSLIPLFTDYDGDGGDDYFASNDVYPGFVAPNYNQGTAAIVFGEPYANWGTSLFDSSVTIDATSHASLNELTTVFSSAFSTGGPIGDIDGDLVTDIAIGHPNHFGAGPAPAPKLSVILMNDDGSVKNSVMLKEGVSGLSDLTTDGLGKIIAAPGDLDGDLIPDMLVGDPSIIRLFYLNNDATVKSFKEYEEGVTTNFDLDGASFFGNSLEIMPDQDSDGNDEWLLAGLNGDFHIMFMDANEDIKSIRTFTGDDLYTAGILPVDPSSSFGRLVGTGDFDGDGLSDFVVNDPFGYGNAMYILYQRETPFIDTVTFDGTDIDIDYDLAMDDGNVPAASDFTVSVDGSTVLVSSVGIVGTTVTLTMPSALLYNQVVEVSYTRGATPLQTADGGLASSVTRRSATHVGVVPAPTLLGTFFTENQVILEYNDTMDEGSIPSTSDFTVTSEGKDRVISTVTIDGKFVYLNMANDLLFSGVVLVDYTSGGAPLMSTFGENAANFTDSTATFTGVAPSETTTTRKRASTSGSTTEQSITQLADAPGDPFVVSSEINGLSNTEIILNFNEALNEDSVPTEDAFNIVETSPQDILIREVVNVAIQRNRLIVSLEEGISSIESDVELTYNERIADGSPLEDLGGNNVGSLLDYNVTNTIDRKGDITPPLPVVATLISRDTVEILFNEELFTGSVPATRDFRVYIDDRTQAVSDVTISDSSVFVRFFRRGSQDGVIRMDYLKGTNPIADTSLNEIKGDILKFSVKREEVDTIVENTTNSIVTLNGGDSNDDGILDQFQNNVATIIDPVTNAPMTLISNQSICKSVQSFNLVSIEELGVTSDIYDFPLGAFTNELECEEAGVYAEFTVIFPYLIDSSLFTFVKLDNEIDQFVADPSLEAEFSTYTYPEGENAGYTVTRLDYKVRDGGKFDADGKVNGVIIDPGALATAKNLVTSSVQSLVESVSKYYLEASITKENRAGGVFEEAQASAEGSDLLPISGVNPEDIVPVETLEEIESFYNDSPIADVVISDNEKLLLETVGVLNFTPHSESTPVRLPFGWIFNRDVKLSSETVTESMFNIFRESFVAKALVCKNIPTIVVRRGDYGNNSVAWVQRMLDIFYGTDLLVDGNYGRRTALGVREFQRREGLTVTGVWGANESNLIRERVCTEE